MDDCADDLREANEIRRWSTQMQIDRKVSFELYNDLTSCRILLKVQMIVAD